MTVLLGPGVQQAYHYVRGSWAAERALAWPEPQPSDALPALRDPAAANDALAQLRASSGLTLVKSDVHRRMAHLYMALSDWTSAAEELDAARTAQPNDPLLAWELALVNEQQLRAVARAPRESILPDLLSADYETPQAFVPTSFCEAGRPATCYIASQQYRQPFADDRYGDIVTLNTLFMYPPSAVRLKRPIYSGHPVLSFALGLDPDMRDGRSDGATFEVWITPPSGARLRVFSQFLDHETAAKGWVPAQVDLSTWAGQEVVLELRTTGGPAGDTTDDWYAWGDVALTTPEAASTKWHLLERRIERLWNEAGVDAGVLVERANTALRQEQYASAAAWYARASIAEPGVDGPTRLRAAFASVISDGTLPPNVRADDLGVYALDQEIQVAAAALRLAYVDPSGEPHYGELVSDYPTNEPGIGTLWWNGAAVAFVDVQSSGSFRMTVRARNTKPGPIELSLEHNMRPLTTVSLDREDGSWQEVSVDIELGPGLHTVGVRYLNDGAVSGVDRNAQLEWIGVERHP